VMNSKERKEVVDDDKHYDNDDDVSSFVSTLDHMPPEGTEGDGANSKDVESKGVNSASSEDGLHNDNMSFSLSVDDDGDDGVQDDDHSNDLLLTAETTQTGG